MLSAWTRAYRLLARNLRPSDVDSLQREGVLRVRGGTSGAIYHISYCGGVRIPGVCRLCVMFVSSMPAHDVLLAMALYIRHDEPCFLRAANCLEVIAPDKLERVRLKCGIGEYWEYRYLFGELPRRQ